MPGVGKSTTAVRLAALLNYAVVVGTDEIRECVRLYDKSEVLKGTSHDRWQMFGPLNSFTFNQGYLAQSRTLQSAVMAVINRNLSQGESLIVEGVHLIPSLYQQLPEALVCHCLLYLSNDHLHQRNLASKAKRRLGNKPIPAKQYAKHVTRVQDYLLSEAKQYQLLTIESGSSDQNALLIINQLKLEEGSRYVPDYSRQNCALQPLC
jgi:2-phosphoglycerate kinase